MRDGNWHLLAVILLVFLLSIPGRVAAVTANAACDPNMDCGKNRGKFRDSQPAAAAEAARRRAAAAEAERQQQEMARREREAELQAERQRQAEARQRRQEDSQRREQARQRAEAERVQRHNQQVLATANARIQGYNNQAQALTGMVDVLANAWQAKMQRDDERDQLRREQAQREEEERRWQEEEAAIRAQEEEAERQLQREEEELLRRQEEAARLNAPAQPLFDLVEKDDAEAGGGDAKLAALMISGGSGDTEVFGQALFGSSGRAPAPPGNAGYNMQDLGEALFESAADRSLMDKITEPGKAVVEGVRDAIKEQLLSIGDAQVREYISRLPETLGYNTEVFYTIFASPDTRVITPLSALKNLKSYFHEMAGKNLDKFIDPGPAN